jgi:hypothetical protein
MAPKALEGAAFEKDCRPDAGTIVDGEPLDVEDHAFGDTHVKSFNQDRLKYQQL